MTAVCAREKADRVRAIGADRVVARDDDLVGSLGAESVDVVVDNVSGPAFGRMLDVLKRGGRYVSSGAIGGPLVTLDKRTFYLKDLTLIGCTAWDAPVFPEVIRAIERGECGRWSRRPSRWSGSPTRSASSSRSGTSATSSSSRRHKRGSRRD